MWNHDKYWRNLLIFTQAFNIIILIISYSIIDTVRSVVFSPNGEYLVTVSSDGTVNLIETSKYYDIVYRFDK